MKNKKVIICLILSLIIFILILILFFALQIKDKSEYQINSMNFKAPTTEEESIGWIEGKIIIPDYNGEYDAVISAYLTSAPETVIEQVVSDVDGNYIMYFENAGEYNIIIEQNECIEYKCMNITITSGEILKLSDITLINGDINEDNEIEIMDLTDIESKFSISINDNNKKYDLNKDGKIDELDRNIVKNNYGKKATEQVVAYTIRLVANEPVAQIGETTYKTLTAAITAVPTTGVETTITMLKNISGTTYYTIPSTKNIKLDLNGKKITYTNTTHAINNNGTLTIVDDNRIKGKIVTTSTGNSKVINTSKMLNIEDDITIQGAGYYGIYVAGGTANINSGNISGANYSGIYVYSTSTIVVNVNNAKVEGKHGIYAIGGTTNINTNTIIGTSLTGIYASGNATVINIEKAYINGTYGIQAASTGTIVNIGEDDSIIDYDSIEIIGTTSGIYSTTTATFNFYDGKIKGKTNAINVKNLVLADGYQKVILDETIMEELESIIYEVAMLAPENMVAMVENTKISYSTLNAAIASINTEELTEIIMLANTIENNIISENQNIKINLNGKIIQSTINVFEVYGNLNITSDEEGGKIISTDNYAVNNSGTVSIGTTNTSTGEPSIINPILQGIEAIHINDGAITKIYDGKFIGSKIVDIDLNGVPWKNGAILGNVTEFETGYEFKGYEENGVFVKELKAIGPQCIITSSAGLATAASTNIYTFKFDEPVVGFTADDIIISSGIKSTFTVVSEIEYTLIVNSITAGNHIVTVPAGKCQAIADGHNNKLATLTVMVDRTGPTVSIADTSSSSPNETVYCTIYTITVTDPNLDASSFTLADVTLGAASYVEKFQLDLISNSGGVAVYEFYCGFSKEYGTPMSSPIHSITIPAGVILDTCNNKNSAYTKEFSSGSLISYPETT